MKRLVLLGGGHAHVHALTKLAKRPIRGWGAPRDTPSPANLLGMLPGRLAGHYPLDACAIALDRLAAAASIDFNETAGSAVDLSRNALRCANGSNIGFDLLSIDTGPLPALDDLPGARAHALPVWPIEDFIAAWPPLVERMRAQRHRFDLVMLGAGAAGVELALAIQHRAAHEGWPPAQLTVVGADDLPLPGMPGAIPRQAARLLAQRGVAWLGARHACRIDTNAIAFDHGEPLAFDACIVAASRGPCNRCTGLHPHRPDGWVWRRKDRIDRAFVRRFGTRA